MYFFWTDHLEKDTKLILFVCLFCQRNLEFFFLFEIVGRVSLLWLWVQEWKRWEILFALPFFQAVHEVQELQFVLFCPKKNSK